MNWPLFFSFAGVGAAGLVVGVVIGFCAHPRAVAFIDGLFSEGWIG